MALENTVAKYTVQITQDGTTAPAVAEFNNLRAAAQGAAAGTSTATNGLRELRETSMLTRESTRVLSESVLLLGGGSMGELAKGALLASEGLRALRTASMLAGASVAEVGVVGLAGLIPIVATAVEGWKAYKAAIEEANSESALFAQTQNLIARNLDAMGQAMAKGLIKPEDYELITKLLLLGTSSSLQSAQEKMAALGVSQVQISNYEKLQKLEAEMHESTMDHFDQERDKALQVYQERIAAIQKLTGSGGMTAAEGTKAQAGAQAELDSKNSSINDAEYEKNQASVIKGIDDDLFFYQQSLADKRKLTADEEFTYRVNDFKKAVQQGLVSEDQYTAYVIEQERKRVAGDAQEAQLATENLQKQSAAQKQLQDLQNKVDEENLTGEDRKKKAIEDTTNAWIAQYTALAKELGYSQQQIDAFVKKAQDGAKVAETATEETKKDMTDLQKGEVQVAQDFSNGLVKAIHDFADGTKSAGQAFAEFAVSMIQDIADIIIKAEALALIMPMLGFKNVNGNWVPANSTVTSGGDSGGGGGSGILGSVLTSLLADGGMKFAADGVMSVSSPTYFPRFNTVAGEQGMEMLTVLARPTFRSIGGMDAVVGMAGNNRLAITNADDLTNRNGSGNGGGEVHIVLHGTPDFEARVVSNSVKSARVHVANDMRRDSQISRNVKGLTA